jgi:hypothetical protein
MIRGLRYFDDSGNYKFGCPEGTWRGCLDHRCWGKCASLLLYFHKYGDAGEVLVPCLFQRGLHAPGPSFKISVHEGDVFMLITSVTAGGNPCLIAASPAAKPEAGVR